jgi:hypothetical protein
MIMNEANFANWVRGELADYVVSDEFKARCAAVRERQTAGEVLDVPEIARALGIPLWLCEGAMLATEQAMAARVIVPETRAVN